MDGNEVYSGLSEVLSELLDRPADGLRPDMSLEELGLDSVERVEFLSQVEEQFDVEIPQSDAIHLTTVDALVRYLSFHRSA